MARSLRDDGDLREDIKLKCKNDFGLDLSPEEISLCIVEMERQRLDLFHKQIWPNVHKIFDRDTQTSHRRITWDPTIDGFRAIAMRHGFAGVDAPIYVEGESMEDLRAQVQVYRFVNDKRCPFVGEARYSEFAVKTAVWENGRKTNKMAPNHQWRQRPYNQLAVAAERQALRKAFQELDEEIRSDLGAVVYPDPELIEGDDKFTEGFEAAIKAKLEKEEPKEESKKEERSEAYVYSRDEIALFQEIMGQRIIEQTEYPDSFALRFDSGIVGKYTKRSDGCVQQESRNPRKDSVPGGRKWTEGDLYFEGEKILKVETFEDKNVAVLELDSGHKVKLDRWGKETARKELEIAEFLEGGKKPIDKAVAAREFMIVQLKKYCEEKNDGVKMSPKQAAKEVLGVEFDHGRALSDEQYRELGNKLQELNG